MDDPQISDIEWRSGRRARSLRKALAERDWTGIAIELIVVTLGVLLAFQINQWADRQKQARDEREFLERLYSENRKAIDELTGVIGSHRKSMEEIGIAIRAKDNPAELAEFAKSPRFGCLGAVLPSVSFSDTESQEILASGKLSIVSDPQLRSLLRDLVAMQAFGAAQLEYARQSVAQISSALDAYERYDIPADPKQRPPCNMDWTALLHDQSAINAAVKLYRFQQLMMAVRSRELARSDDVERKLACELRKPECAAR
ncbi:MAG: hypothetical protein HOP95_03600 [Sphingomonas sp.]|nr:hypothetical protein [Sphingomonas sp.]